MDNSCAETVGEMPAALIIRELQNSLFHPAKQALSPCETGSFSGQNRQFRKSRVKSMQYNPCSSFYKSGYFHKFKSIKPMNKTIINTATRALLCLLIIAAMAATTMLLASCTEEDMDIKKLGAEQKMTLFCFPTTESDTTCISLMRSVPITDNEPETIFGTTTEQLKLSDAHVTFTLNGVEQDVKYATEQTGSVPAGNYYVVCRIAEGDKVEVSAAADGLPAVSSMTTVPVCEGIKSIGSATAVHDLTLYKQLLVELDGASMRGSYYAVTVSAAYTLQGKDNEGNGLTKDYCRRLTADLTDEPLISPMQIDSDLFGYEGSFYDNFYIFNGSNITSDSYTIRLNVYDGQYFDTSEFDSGMIINPRIEVRLYKIDTALYRFLKSINDLIGNDLPKYGLAPVLPTYSNISNGIGVLGGCGVKKAEVAIQLDDYSFYNYSYVD